MKLKIDYAIRNFIILLNERGYKTKSCCQGHPITEYNFNRFLIQDAQEKVLNYSKQFNKTLRDIFSKHKLSANGYIFFENKKDCLAIYSIFKKTKHKKRFSLTAGYNNKHISLNTRGLTQDKINKIWQEVSI